MSYFPPYVVAVLLHHLFEQYVRVRKSRRLALRGVPTEVREALPSVDEADYRKAQEYSAAKNSFGAKAAVYRLVLAGLSLWYSPWFWNGPTERAVLWLGLSPGHELARMGVSMVATGALELVLSMPLDAYSTFVIEERFGFNKHTLRSWLSDSLKHFLVEELLLGATMMSALVLLLRNLGSSAWFYLWAFLTMFALVFNVIHPIWIAPLFNTFKPLEDGPLRDSIERIVKASGITCDRIFEVDGSRQSSHSNAYVAGFFRTKRIVIYDTLLKDLLREVEPISAVVAHEIGHAKMHHNYMLLGVTASQFFVMFFTFGFCQSDLRMVTDFGYTDPCTFLTLQTFFLLYQSLVLPIFTILLNGFTRQLEFAADAYSVKLGFDIRGALARISKTNLSDLNPDPLDSFCHHSHPTTVQRVAAVSRLLGKAAPAGGSARSKSD